MGAVYGRCRTIPEAGSGQKQSVHVQAMEGKSPPMRLVSSTAGSGFPADRGDDEDQETT